MHAHTWFCQRHEIRHILHEDATFKLQLRLATLVHEWFGGEFVLRLAEIDVLAAKQYRLKEVDVVLQTGLAFISAAYNSDGLPVFRHLCRWPGSHS